jgi:hypothetical protein
MAMQAVDRSGHQLGLSVNVAGRCRLTGPAVWLPDGESHSVAGPLKAGEKRYPHGLICGRSNATPLTGAAAAIGGLRAFWTVDGLAWEYAPRAWAELSWTIHGPLPPTRPAATRALMVRVASHVRFGSAVPLAFPFRLTGLPAGWHVTESTPAVFGGRLMGVGLYLGPAADSYALGVLMLPAPGPSWCTWGAGTGTYQKVTVDGTDLGTYQKDTVGGASGILRTIDEPGKHWQSLCFADIHGLDVWMDNDLANPFTSDAPLPGEAGLGGLLNIFRHHVQLFGPNPANWTTHPLG